MLLRRALIRAGFAYHRLLTLSMAYVASPQGRKIFAQIPKLPENPLCAEPAQERSGPEVLPANPSRNWPRKVETTPLPRGGPAILRW